MGGEWNRRQCIAGKRRNDAQVDIRLKALVDIIRRRNWQHASKVSFAET